MWPYLNLLRSTLNEGKRQKNRTGIDTFMIPGGMMQFNCQAGFPILTTKKVNFDAVKAELVGFIRGVTSAVEFRKLGTKVWDKNANENEQWLKNPYREGEDDLGPIYGHQWRNWSIGTSPGDVIDQLAGAIHKIVQTPQDRRIIVSAWNPVDIGKMALPPCHLLYQFLVGQEGHLLHMTMYMRSCDMFLGVPFNISSYALLLHIVAEATGYNPGMLTMFLADVHIYENHVEQVRLQLDRIPRPHPKLLFSDHVLNVLGLPSDADQVTKKVLAATAMEFIDSINPEDVTLQDYEPHPAIKGEMAV